MERLEVQTAIAGAVEEVLETMCFTFVVSGSETAAAETGGDPLVATLRFEGRPSGELSLSVPLVLARGLSSCFLGREPDEISDSQAAELVCELANMFCGSALSRLEAGTIFHLSHPELAPAGPPPDDSCRLGPAIARKFELEGGVFAVSLAFRQVE